MSEVMEQPAEMQDSAPEANADGASQNGADGRDEDLDILDPDSDEQPEEEEEVEIGDRKLAMPKSVAEKLKAERMMHADYTQKTQTVADERKQVAAEREQMQKHQEEAKQYLDDLADIRAVEKQLKQLNDMDLTPYLDTDPVGVMRIQEQRRVLELQKQDLVSKITQKQQQQALSEQQATAKQVQDAEAYLKREIPEWTEQRTKDLSDYAVKNGIDPKALWGAVFKQPAVAKLLHKAELYDKLLAKQAPKPQAAPEAKPALRVGSNAAVKKDPTKMTDKEFAAYRKSVSKRK
jgi:hypothetical protein